MKRTWKEAVRLEFKGARFQDHALDLGALAELAQFQKMVAETAKALWRAANPNRERLPQHFEERTRLCLRRMDPGSAVVPLDVLIEDGDGGQAGLPPEAAEPAEPKELRDAITLSQEVYAALDRDAALPERFPKELVTEYAKWGQSLAAEESIEFHAPGKRPARVSSTHRQRLARFHDVPHETHVELTGEVLEADVRRKRFQLWIDEWNSVQVGFSEEQESEVTTALRDHRIVRMRVLGIGEVSHAGKIQRIRQVDELAIQTAGRMTFDASARPIEEVIAELAAEVPEEEWEKLPRDWAENLDDYLYGTPE